MSFVDRLSGKLFPPRVTRDAVSRDGLDADTMREFASIPDLRNRTAASGMACDVIYEAVPKFIKAPCEHVISSRNNSWIVLGRDRPASRESGYGGKGHTQCASIDIVCGRMGADPRRVDAEGQELYADPSYKYDAARIYMSQKTDVDKNFALAAGKVGSARAKSAIGLKADGVRIIAREGIKLVTKTDRRNSQGGQVHSNSGIDLIAGNNDRTLQPLVLGDNLKKALGDIVNQVEKLNGIVNTFLMAQMEYNAFSQSHFHISPGFGAPTPPAMSLLVGGITTAVKLLGQTQLSLVAQKANLAKYKIQYLNPASRSYINSRFNNVN